MHYILKIIFLIYTLVFYFIQVKLNQRCYIRSNFYQQWNFKISHFHILHSFNHLININNKIEIEIQFSFAGLVINGSTKSFQGAHDIFTVRIMISFSSIFLSDILLSFNCSLSSFHNIQKNHHTAIPFILHWNI